MRSLSATEGAWGSLPCSGRTSPTMGTVSSFALLPGTWAAPGVTPVGLPLWGGSGMDVHPLTATSTLFLFAHGTSLPSPCLSPQEAGTWIKDNTFSVLVRFFGDSPVIREVLRWITSSESVFLVELLQNSTQILGCRLKLRCGVGS